MYYMYWCELEEEREPWETTQRRGLGVSDSVRSQTLEFSQHHLLYHSLTTSLCLSIWRETKEAAANSAISYSQFSMKPSAHSRYGTYTLLTTEKCQRQ